jgi:hypothetical protein
MSVKGNRVEIRYKNKCLGITIIVRKYQIEEVNSVGLCSVLKVKEYGTCNVSLSFKEVLLVAIYI